MGDKKFFSLQLVGRFDWQKIDHERKKDKKANESGKEIVQIIWQMLTHHVLTFKNELLESALNQLTLSFRGHLFFFISKSEQNIKNLSIELHYLLPFFF